MPWSLVNFWLHSSIGSRTSRFTAERDARHSSAGTHLRRSSSVTSSSHGQRPNGLGSWNPSARRSHLSIALQKERPHVLRAYPSPDCWRMRRNGFQGITRDVQVVQPGIVHDPRSFGSFFSYQVVDTTSSLMVDYTHKGESRSWRT